MSGLGDVIGARFDEVAYLRQQLAERDTTIEKLTAQVAVLARVLLALNVRGGLGLDMHRWITEALADPNPEAERLVKLKRLMLPEPGTEEWLSTLNYLRQEVPELSGDSLRALLAAINEAVKGE